MAHSVPGRWPIVSLCSQHKGARRRRGKGSLRKKDLFLTCINVWVNNSTALSYVLHCLSIGKGLVSSYRIARLFPRISGGLKSLGGWLENGDQHRSTLVFLTFPTWPFPVVFPRHLLFIFSLVVFQRLWICLKSWEMNSLVQFMTVRHLLQNNPAF